MLGSSFAKCKQNNGQRTLYLAGDPCLECGPVRIRTWIFKFHPSVHFMSLLRLYTRVLELLGKEARLGWILAGANLLWAGAQFAEPVMFGRILGVLSGKPDP